MLKIFLLFLPVFAFAEAHLVAGCRLLKTSGEVVMAFPGRSCSFLTDGTFLSHGPTHLRRFSSGGEVLWEKKLSSEKGGHVLSGNHVLLISGKSGDPKLYDLSVLDLNGEVLLATDTRTLFGGEKDIEPTDFRRSSGGGYYLSLYGDGVYFLDENLKLKGRKLVLARNHQVRSVRQISEKNFSYLIVPAERSFAPAIVAEEFDGEKKRVVFRFPKTPVASFYFPHGGSLERSGDRYVLAHPISGSYIVSRKSGELLEYLPETHFDQNMVRIPEEVMMRDLDRFLERWKF